MFEINARGIEIKLQIKGYKPTDKDNWYNDWCKCDYLFSSDNWLHYHGENDDVLLSYEVEQLEEACTKLLDNKLTEIKEIVCIEPDFVFKLYPQTDLRDNPKIIYIRPGHEIQDIYLEWKIFFWHDGITKNHLSITLDREEIVKLRNYLLTLINQ